MLSPFFVVKLCPDLLCHRLILGSGVLFMLAGILLLSNMEGFVYWRLGGAALWCADCCRSLWRFSAARAAVNLILLDSDGGVRTKCSMGRTTVRTLRAGSCVFANFAWLRLGSEDRGVYGGLFVRSRINAGDWHRLQLLWQQYRMAFGHRPGP